MSSTCCCRYEHFGRGGKGFWGEEEGVQQRGKTECVVAWIRPERRPSTSCALAPFPPSPSPHFLLSHPLLHPFPLLNSFSSPPSHSQILDDGRVTDSQGRVVSFKNTIIILTSNLGSGAILESVGQAQELVSLRGR